MASPVLHVTLSKSAIDASIAFLGPFSIDRRRVLGRAFFCILFILLCGPLLLCNSPPPFDPGGAPPTATSHAPITNATPLITPSLPHLSTPHRNDCNEIDDRRVVRGETKQTTTTTKPKRKETPQKQSVVGFVCVLFFCLFVFAFFFAGGQVTSTTKPRTCTPSRRCGSCSTPPRRRRRPISCKDNPPPTERRRPIRIQHK